MRTDFVSAYLAARKPDPIQEYLVFDSCSQGPMKRSVYLTARMLLYSVIIKGCGLKQYYIFLCLLKRNITLVRKTLFPSETLADRGDKLRKVLIFTEHFRESTSICRTLYSSISQTPNYLPVRVISFAVFLARLSVSLHEIAHTRAILPTYYEKKR